jgi:hypothetical protein
MTTLITLMPQPQPTIELVTIFTLDGNQQMLMLQVGSVWNHWVDGRYVLLQHIGCKYIVQLTLLLEQST